MHNKTGLTIVVAVLAATFASLVVVVVITMSAHHAPHELLGTPTAIVDVTPYHYKGSIQGFGTGVVSDDKQEARKAELFQAMKTTALSSEQLQEVESYGDQLNVHPGETYDVEAKRIELNIALAMQIKLQREAMSDMLAQMKNPQCVKKDDLGVLHPSMCAH